MSACESTPVQKFVARMSGRVDSRINNMLFIATCYLYEKRTKVKIFLRQVPLDTCPLRCTSSKWLNTRWVWASVGRRLNGVRKTVFILIDSRTQGSALVASLWTATPMSCATSRSKKNSHILSLCVRTITTNEWYRPNQQRSCGAELCNWQTSCALAATRCAAAATAARWRKEIEWGGVATLAIQRTSAVHASVRRWTTRFRVSVSKCASFAEPGNSSPCSQMADSAIGNGGSDNRASQFDTATGICSIRSKYCRHQCRARQNFMWLVLFHSSKFQARTHRMHSFKFVLCHSAINTGNTGR